MQGASNVQEAQLIQQKMTRSGVLMVRQVLGEH